jgi:phosphoserine phosphatase
VAEDLGLDDVLCNRFEVDETGAHTGRPVGTLCFGAGKLDYAEVYAGDRGVSLADCWFYTDSFSDLPVLERVGHPVVVNPDPRLRREAERRALAGRVVGRGPVRRRRRWCARRAFWPGKLSRGTRRTPRAC